MHVRDRRGRWAASFGFLALAALAAVAGCQETTPTEPGDDSPQFAKPPATAVGLTLWIEAENQDGVDYVGPLYAVVYDAKFGLEVAAAYDCGTPQTIDGVDYCTGPGPISVEKGTKAVVIVPGSLPPALEAEVFRTDQLLPLQDADYGSNPWDCETQGCSIGASVTDVQKGKVVLLPLVPGNFAGGFDLKVNNDVEVNLGAPVASEVRALQYEDFGPGSNDNNVDFPLLPPTTATVMPLCPGTDLPSNWTFVGAAGVWPAVPMAFFGAQEYETEVWLPYPKVESDYSTYERSCDGYPGTLPLWVTELNFINQEAFGVLQNTILETFEIRSADELAQTYITRYARPLLCDASLAKAYADDEPFGDASDGIDFLPPLVSGFQALIGADLSLDPNPRAVAGWYTQYLTDPVNVTFTLKNTSADGSSTFNFSVTYACTPAVGSDAADCDETSRQDNSAPDDFLADFNFRNPANNGDFGLAGTDLVETTWSIVGLPFPEGTVRYDVKSQGDKFPLAPGDGLLDGDWEILYPTGIPGEICKDTNDGRWGVG